jgi:HEAT repeat protein
MRDVPIFARAMVLGLAAAWALTASPAAAQYGGGSPGGLGSSGLGFGNDSMRERYNKAKNGANIDEWVRRLGDDDPAKRLEAVKSLGDSGDPKANAYLMQAVGDSDPRIQTKAVDYLGRTRATDSTLFLIQRLFMTGTNEALRHRILMALGKIGDSRASRPILEFVERDIAPDIRGTGIYAVGEIGDLSIRDDLMAFRDREADPRLRRLADEALAKIATRQAVPVRDAGAFPTALDAALQTER